MTMYHAADGIFFSRNDNGSVTILVSDKKRSDIAERTVTLSDSQWASVVSSVSSLGETYDTFQEALHFHNQKQGEL